jgi:SAM-dependent methyltransferase
MTTFGPTYAGLYDRLYAQKDYPAECDALERAFAAHADGPVRSVLDLGCGSGNHALPLARRGYEVVGVDRSEGMLARFREKAAGLPGACCACGDLREVDLGRTFDAALMMFAVLGYQLGNGDVLAALRTARRHLRRGGLFVADFWYGPAVLRERPAERVKALPTPGGQVIRLASGELDERRHVCHVRYRLWHFQGDRLAGEAAETHGMRYFFPLEVEMLLGVCGFELLRLGGFPDLDREPDASSWTVAAVARAA